MVTRVSNLKTKNYQNSQSQQELKFGSKKSFKSKNLTFYKQLMKRKKGAMNLKGPNLHKLSFVGNTESIREIPHKDLFSKADFCSLTLPSISLSRYTPLLYRDPYAKASVRKVNTTLVSKQLEPVKLPQLPAGGAMIGQKKPTTQPEKKAEQRRPVPQKSAINDSGFRGGSTVHFKYSDYFDTDKEKKGNQPCVTQSILNEEDSRNICHAKHSFEIV